MPPFAHNEDAYWNNLRPNPFDDFTDEELNPNNNMEREYLLIIKADVNDADYITNTENIDGETLELVKKVAALIAKKKSEHRYGHNWNNYESNQAEMYPELTEEEIQWFDELLPYGTMDGDEIHSIESIKVFEIKNEMKLL